MIADDCGRPRPIPLLFFVSGLISLLGGCSQAPVVASHSPMHPDNSQAVTFVGSAEGQVDRIDLSYERYSLSAVGGVLTQTLAQADTVVKSCNPAGSSSSLTCSHTMPSAFPANSLIKFTAKAYDSDNKSSTESYFFASGDYPLPDDPIPIRVKGDPPEKLDVVFIRDTDITASSFASQLDEVIDDLYFKYDPIKFWRGTYNFYYSGESGNYEELCSFTNPSNMANLLAVADTVAFLHQTDLRDCRSGTRMSSEIDYDKTLIHETGHALFGMADEYCCDSSYFQQACEPNLWSSLAGCQTDASGIGYPSSDCTQLTNGSDSINFWRIDPSGTGGCIMGPRQHSADSQFAKACGNRMSFRIGKCLGGDCFPTPECP